MRKFILAVSIVVSALQYSSAQTLFSYGNKAATKEEFLRQFNKNLSPSENKAKALNEYLPLFINYKLKVQDAYDNRLDTDYSQINELAEFRRQIEDNYLSEAANLNSLVDEAFTRSQQDIKLQDIYIGFNPKDSVSLKQAKEKADEAFQKLQKGADYNKVLEEFCNDKDFKAVNGNLGWVTVFLLPYNIETEIYKLKSGSYSQPLQTQNAFHIFKKIAERNALGKVKAAQILLAYSPGASEIDKKHTQKLADSIYALLLKGSDFSQLARQYSMDRTSYQNGGLLPEFGIGSYEKAFEDVAFSLTKKGDVSKPFSTSYGVHIIKLIDIIPVKKDKNDATYISEIKQKILADNRMQLAKINLIKTLLPKIGFQLSKTLNKAILWKYTDSTLVNSNNNIKEISNENEIFHFAKQVIKVGDWINFIKATQSNNSGKNYETLFSDYINATGTEYYKKHLEEFNSNFKNQLLEFRDANLNFAITQKMVWNKAEEDTTGLLNYYNANKVKYQWGPSVNAIIFTAMDKETALKAHAEMETDKNCWKNLAMKYENKLLIDSNRFEQVQIPLKDKFEFKAASFTPTVINGQDSSQTFCYIINVINNPDQKTFEDARGLVVNDYQQVLEKNWINELKKKYPVKVNDNLWKQLLKN